MTTNETNITNVEKFLILSRGIPFIDSRIEKQNILNPKLPKIVTKILSIEKKFVQKPLFIFTPYINYLSVLFVIFIFKYIK
jgi:hypothetical protein